MTGVRPTILVVVDDWDECGVIAEVLRDAGFGVVAAADERGAPAAMTRERFAAAVIALPEDDAVEFQRQLPRQPSGLKGLTVIEPAATRFVEFEPVLRQDDDTTPHYSHAAEFGIAAARLACLDSRRNAAAAVGAQGLAHDLTRQIDEARAMHQGLATASTTPAG